MAIYSMHVSSVSRAAGSSSLASLSYIASMRVRDERLGETYYGFGRRERVMLANTILPVGAPSEYGNPEILFNAIEKFEKPLSAVPAKKIMVALPREFDLSTQRKVVEEFITASLTAQGYAASYAIHSDVEGSNPHAHILVANRRIDPGTGAWEAVKAKRVYALDAAGQRIPVIDPSTGVQKVDGRNRRQWKRELVYQNPLGTKDMLLQMRASWAQACNQRLPENLRIDHRSLLEQGRDTIPTIHEGYAAREMEARGAVSDRSSINRDTRRGNRLLTEIKTQLDKIAGLLASLQLLLGLRSKPVDHAEQKPVPERKTHKPEKDNGKKSKRDFLTDLKKKQEQQKTINDIANFGLEGFTTPGRSGRGR
jgi:hypothetical protein